MLVRRPWRGRDVYDFLAGEARYKANLGQPGPDMSYLLTWRPTLPLVIWHALRHMKQLAARSRTVGPG